MVLRYRIAAINKNSVKMEALKRFKDRGYSKKTLRLYEPNIARAKFLKRDRGYSIYEIPLKRR